MNKKTKIILALNQIENLTSLVEDLDYKEYLYNKLVMLQVELNRQLSLCTSS